MSIFMGVNNDRYIAFDDNGNLVSIGRYKDESYSNLKITFDEVREIIEGKESIFNYKVEYDFIEKRYLLKNKYDIEQDQLKESYLYELKKSTTKSDVKIIKNNKNKCWNLEIDPDIFEGIQEGSIYADPKDQYYSVTLKYNPNFLYRVLKFDETCVIPFEFDFEFDNESVSLYTVRKFSTYSFEVIDE